MMVLSVIIPVYNVAPYLCDCLDSLLGQTFGDWEAVCVDDGSTDGSGAILDEYAARDARFKVIHQRNQGVSAARNRALDVAKGEWVGFIDADDSIDHGWFGRMMRHVTDEVDVVHDNAGCAFGIRKPYDDGTYRTFLRDGWSQLNLVRRSVVGDTRYKVGMRKAEDVVFFTELALKTNRIAFVQEPGYHYRSRPDSAIAVHTDERDSLRFAEEISRLGLPRADAARAIGYDLVLWVKGYDWDSGYDPARCGLLRFWRKGVADGTLKVSDVRMWWRPGLRRWLKTGDIGLFRSTMHWRIRLGRLLGR